MRHLARILLLAACLVPGVALPGWAGSLCGTVRNQLTSAGVAHAGIFLRTPAGAYTGINGATDVAGAFCIANVPAGTYDIEVRVDNYQVGYLRGVVVTTSSTDVELPAALDGLRFASPMPNPARTATQFSWTLGSAGWARLSIFDARGRLVRAWASAALSAGEHSQAWNLTDATGRPVDAGVYFVHLDTPMGGRVRALVRVR